MPTRSQQQLEDFNRPPEKKPPPNKKPHPQPRMDPDPSESSSDDETPTVRPTRQAYQSFNGTNKNERVMLLLALRGELNSKEPKFTKQTLQRNTKNRLLKTLQDEDIDFEKLVVHASKAFSLTWVKQIALGKLIYKPVFLTKYAGTANVPSGHVTKKIKQPLQKLPPADIVIAPPAAIALQSEQPSDHDSEDLLTSSTEATKVPSIVPSPMLTKGLPTTTQDSDISTIAPSPTARRTTPALHQDSDSSTTAQWKRDIDTKINQTMQTETTTTWKETLEEKLQATLRTSIENFKEEILENISTTKGELLSHLDTLRVDMTKHDLEIQDRTNQAEAMYQKLQQQQQTMEDLQTTIQKEILSAQNFSTTFQANALKERTELQNYRDEQRKAYKNDMEQASRQQLAQHERKSDTMLNHARTRQTVDFRQSCRSMQKEYKLKIIAKYENLESESMQIADQAALDLSDILQQVLQQEKNNILPAITPDKILASITQSISDKLESSTETQLEIIKTQRKTVITQLQKTAKRNAEHSIQQRNDIRTDIANGKGTLHATVQHEIATLKDDIAKIRPIIEKQEREAMAAALDDIKSDASIAFSLELDSKVQAQLNDFTTLLKSKMHTHERTTTAPQSMNATSQWPAPTTETAHSIPATPDRPMINRFKLASSKGLEDRLPKFRRDDLYVHLPPDPAQHYMEAFYETLATNMQNFDYPIITLQDLAPRGSTCPASAFELYEHDTIKKIGRALYQKLLGVIPSTCTILHNLLANHSATQDGYRALYAMMRLKCAYLQDLLPTWGPKWQKSATAFEYVSTLQSYLTQERRRNKTYTEFEIAAEMVQQAKRHPEYQLLAGAYMAQLIALPTDTANMSPEFLHENLALNFESNRQNSLPSNPSINKFGQRGGGPSDRKPGEQRRHQYKNPVQCGSCKLFGHCIDSQVCRFSAQFMYTKDYVEKHPDKARANADAYCAANNKTTVNKIYQQFPEKFDDSMTEEEREGLRYEMATTFYNQSDDETVA
jgi:ferredoxin